MVNVLYVDLFRTEEDVQDRSQHCTVSSARADDRRGNHGLLQTLGRRWRERSYSYDIYLHFCALQSLNIYTQAFLRHSFEAHQWPDLQKILKRIL